MNQPLIDSVRRLASLAILVTIALMFLILSCHGGPLQFNQGFGYSPVGNTCEEHSVQSNDTHTAASIFDGVNIPDRKVFIFAIVFALAFTVLLPLSERYSRTARIAFRYHQRKRWVWARHTPFSSSTFLPYFAAQRDQ